MVFEDKILLVYLCYIYVSILWGYIIVNSAMN